VVYGYGVVFGLYDWVCCFVVDLEYFCFVFVVV